jgi:multicomponent Na+:H+ antiporter subunit F
MMDLFWTASGIAIFAMMMILLYRLVRGPTVIDRILSVNVVGTKTMVLLVIIGTIFGRVDMFVDLAITYALLNFLGSIAAAKYFRRDRTVEQQNTGAAADRA